MERQTVRLSEIFCQDRAIGSLQRAFAAGRMAHAYLFAGPPGVGRRTTAEAWARMLLCRERVTGPEGFADSCGQCASCRLFDAGSHPDFQPIRKELRPYTGKDKGLEAKQDLPMSVVKEYLIDKAPLRPQMADHVVFLVHEAERLNTSSQNALLKLLEEPPGHCLIILLCSRLERMLSTIHSRCQVVQFGPIDEAVLVERLTADGLGAEEAAFWARFCQGSLGEAQRWAALDVDGGGAYAIYTGLLGRLVAFGLPQAVDLAGDLADRAKALAAAWARQAPDAGKTDLNRRALKGLLTMIQSIYRDAMFLAAGHGPGLGAAGPRGEIRRLAERYDVETLGDFVARAADRMGWVEASVNERLLLEELLLYMGGCAIIQDL